MPHVLIAGKIHASGLKLLERAEGVSFTHVEEVSKESYIPLLAEADALLIRTQPLTETGLAQAGRLRIVSRHGVGYDAVDHRALAARGIPLAIVGDVNTSAVAEHALMLMLAASKLAIRADRAVREENWSWGSRLEAGELLGKKLLIVGFGRIGQRVAQLATVFGVEIRAFDPFLLGQGWPEGPVAAVESLQAGLGWADIVTLHLPHSERPIIGQAELDEMRSGAVLVNTSRGSVVEEAALVAGLHSGKLRAAGLDVFETEPLPAGHPLSAMDNVVLTPHIAGLTTEGGERLAVKAVRNILDFFDGTLDPGLVVNGVAVPDRAQVST